MTKTLSILIAIFISCSVAQAYSAQPPERIILHNAANFEVIESIPGKYVSPKEDTTLYLRAGDKTSPVMSTIKKDSFAAVLNYELHTFPLQNSFILTKRVSEREFKKDNPGIKIAPPANHDEVYYLAYRGEGRFQAWWRGHIVWLQPKYKVEIKSDEFWLCLQHPETGMEGWALLEDDKWHESAIFAIFFNEIPEKVFNAQKVTP